MNVNVEVMVKIKDHSPMGINVEFLDYKGLLMWNNENSGQFRKYLLIPNELILCKIIRIDKKRKSFDAILI